MTDAVGPNSTRASAGPSDDRATGGGMRARVAFLPPKVLRHWVGEYPESAFRKHAQGAVQLLVTVDANGRLVATHVASSSGNDALDEAAIATVQRYVFKAGERDGIAEPMDAYIEINWTITPAVIRRFSPGEISLSLPMSLSEKRVKTRFGSYLETTKLDSEQNSTQ